MTLRRVVSGVGRACIASGILILLFVAFQLWGTGITEARSQERLRQSFEAAVGPEVEPPAPTASTSSTVPVPAPPPPPEGEAVAIMSIPKLGLEKAVVEGVGVAELKDGPGHYPNTPMPGQPGNAAIAGHRTTYGAPFHRLDELQPGDPILVTTTQGRFRYEVTETLIVRPSQTEVLDGTQDNRLTLTTCHPRFSAAQRLIVVATLVGETAEPPPPATAPTPRPGRAAGDDLDAGLSGDPTARGPALLWAFLVALVALAAWLWGRVWHPWKAGAVMAAPFLIVLFIFFENFSRLLPANI